MNEDHWVGIVMMVCLTTLGLGALAQHFDSYFLCLVVAGICGVRELINLRKRRKK